MTRPPSTASSPVLIAVAGALMVAASIGIGRFAYTPLLPQMLDRLGWNVAQAGDVASSNYLGYLLGAVLTSLLAQRRQRHLWLLLGCLLSAATTLAGVMVGSYVAWLGLRFVAGVASAFGFVLATAVVMQVAAESSRPQLMAVHYLGPGLGMISSVAMIELAKAAGASMFQQWAILGAVSLAMFALAWWLMQRIFPQTVYSHSVAGTDELSSYPGKLWRVAIAYGLFGFAYIITATFLVTIARGSVQHLWLEPATWIAVGVGALPSLFIWLKIAKRLGTASAFRLSFVTLGVSVLLSGLGTNSLLLLLSGLLLGFTIVGSTGLGISVARSLSPRHRDRVIAWMTMSFGLGQFLGPAIAGRLALISDGFLLPSLLGAGLSVAAIVLLNHTTVEEV